jgi:septum formation topological specificity factor MinE
MEDRQYYLLPTDADIMPQLRGELCCVAVLSKYGGYSFDMVRVNVKDARHRHRLTISQSRLIPVTNEVADIMEGYKIDNA